LLEINYKYQFTKWPFLCQMKKEKILTLARLT
jgi:hypothetical protein